MSKRGFEVLRTAIAIAVAFVILFVVIIFISDEPFVALHSIFIAPLTSVRNFGNVIEMMIPMMFCKIRL